MQADTYPSRAITIVVPFPPGASNDIAARLLRDYLAEKLKQNVVVENRSGAAGTTPTAQFTMMAPDGYSLLLAINAPITTNPFFQKNYPFDPKTSLTPICWFANATLMMGVNPSLPVTSVSELIAYAKANPSKN